MNTLKNNAYHILGLDITASEKEILKRSKEIINRLKIDDYPEYDLDIGIFKDFRTEDAVKEALQRLQAPKKRIKEYFFWFQIADSVDEQALGLLKTKDYLNAIRIWQNAAEGESAKAFLYKRNLAILYCIVLSVENDQHYLQDSLNIWKAILDSDKFWASFSKMYKLHDEQTASDDVISDFKKHVISYLSDIYTELHELHNDPEYIHEFQRVFSAKGEKIEKKVLNPVYQTIHEAVEKLEKMNVSADNKFDKEESDQIKNAVGVIQSELNKLIDLGLYDDSQTKIMRDRAANALRGIVLDLHNNLSELQKSQKLLEVAVNIAGTDSLKNKLKDELEQIEKNVKDDAENSMVVEIASTFKTSHVVFKNSYVEYNGKKIFFKDAKSISFDSTATTSRVYGVPVSTSYSYRWSVVSDQDTISISLSASRDESKQKNEWVKLVGLASNLIAPLIVKRLAEQIMDKGETITFGSVKFSKQGYSKEKFKLFGKNETLFVYWSDTIYIPKFHQGQVVLWEDKDGKSSVFASVPMSTPNAVVLPELVQACYDRRERK